MNFFYALIVISSILLISCSTSQELTYRPVDSKELWVYAGSIVIDTRDREGVGRNNSIVVPDMFYQILIMNNPDETLPEVLAFLFPHFKEKQDPPDNIIYNYLVPVNFIETITGLDFFNEFTLIDQEVIEGTINIEPWKDFINH